MSWAAKAEVLTAARQQLDLSPDELWIAYYAIGGTLSVADLHKALGGRLELSRMQYDVLAQALNDRFIETGADHVVPYAEDFPPEVPAG